MSMHCFFVAQLPQLALNLPAPYSVAEFDASAQEELSAQQLHRLVTFDGFTAPGETLPEDAPLAYRKYAEFEEYLRNRIAHKRAEALNLTATWPDPPAYFGEVDLALTQALAAPDPEQREKLLDQVRWNFLEELELGHDFDFEKICIYRLKLRIVNKYIHRAPERGRTNFDALLDQISPAPER